MPDTNLASAVFTPASIALIGLSRATDRPAGRPLGFLRREGYRGRILIVNTAREEVQGERAYPSVASLPEVPEHAFLLLGTDNVEEAVRDCATAGVRVATVLADGFAEAGAEGRARQDRLVEIARAAGMRLLGPNSMGVADLHAGCLLTVNAVYTEPGHLTGHVALISQSGSMIGALVSRARALGVGFSRVAAVGNEADLGVAELGLACVEDPATEVILLFLETIRDADGLARLSSTARAAGKPVIAYKLGRSDLGAEMAVAHTGALLAEDAVTEAFLRDIGIARVTMLDALIEAPALFRGRTPPARPPRIGVVTTTGGGGAMVCDRLALEGMTVQPPSDATLATVRETGLEIVRGPVLDLTMAGAGEEFVRTALTAVAADPEVEIVLSVTGSSGRAKPEATIAAHRAAAGAKPLAGFLTPDAPEALSGLIGAGIPCFRTPESCADALRAYCMWRPARLERLGRPPATATPQVLDEGASLTLLAELGVPCVPSVTSGIGGAPALPFPYPVVAKVLSDAVPHKTEAGGVVLNIQGPEALADATRQIKISVERHHPTLDVDRVLVAPMLRPLQEVLIGYRLDPQVGPVVTLAPGGVLVGIYADKAVRLAPVDLATAWEMINEVNGLEPLRGYRGLPEGDLAGLAGALVALSQLAHHPRTVLEAEANPVMVMTDSVAAADALITLGESP